MIIWQSRICSADIEAVVDHWGQSIVSDLENGGQAPDEDVVQLFEVNCKKLAAEMDLKKGLQFVLKKYICGKYRGKTRSLHLKLG